MSNGVKIEKGSNIRKCSVDVKGAKDVEIRWLISKEDGGGKFCDEDV